MIHSRWFRWFGRFVIASSLLFLVFTQVDLSTTFRTLSDIRISWLIPLLGIYFLIRLIWAWQMSLGLAPLEIEFSVFYLFKVLLISGFYSLVLPGGMVAGGVASLYKLSSNKTRILQAGTLLAYFRIVNSLMIFVTGLFGMMFDHRLAQPYLRIILSIALILTSILFLPLLSSRVASLVEKLLQNILVKIRLKPKLKQIVISFWQILSTMTKLPKPTVALAFGLALISQLLGVFLYWMIAQELRIDLSIFSLGWIRTFLTAVQMLPLSIGGLGMREVSVIYLLREYGVQEPKALAFSLILFSLMVIVGLLGGVLEGLDILGKRKHANEPRGKTNGHGEENQDAGC
jgi:uncharacterized membrane protein YbhN (UPF0104 family)